MMTRRGLSLNAGAHARTQVLLALIALPACSGTDSNASSGGEVFKSANAENVVAAAGVTNVVAVSFLAPSNGFAWLSGTGTCSVIEPLPVSSVLRAGIETGPGDSTVNAGDATFLIAGGQATPDSGAFSVTRTVAAPTGGNTLYLNVENPSSGGKLYCSATLTALFSHDQLP
jgi:hypothetical protein